MSDTAQGSNVSGRAASAAGLMRMRVGEQPPDWLATGRAAERSVRSDVLGALYRVVSAIPAELGA